MCSSIDFMGTFSSQVTLRLMDSSCSCDSLFNHSLTSGLKLAEFQPSLFRRLNRGNQLRQFQAEFG